MTKTQEEKMISLLGQIHEPTLKARFEQEYKLNQNTDTVNTVLETIIDMANSYVQKSIEFPIEIASIDEKCRLELDKELWKTSQTGTHTANFSEGYDLFVVKIDMDYHFTDGYMPRKIWSSPMLETLKLYRYAVATPSWLRSSYHCLLALNTYGCLRSTLQRVIAHNLGYSTWSYITDGNFTNYDLVDDAHKEELALNDSIVFVPTF